MTREREKITHPSFGMIGFTRTQCGGNVPLFGSELAGDSYIELVIQPAEMERDLSNDWFYGRGRGGNYHAKVRMTPVQFSELITNMNVGDGVPCTVIEVKGEKIEQRATYESKKDATHRQFRTSMNAFANGLMEDKKNIDAICKKAAPAKKDFQEVANLASHMIQEITSNLPFFMKTFQEAADKVVVEAKAEVEAAILHKILKMGIEAFSKEQTSMAIEDSKD